MAAPRLDGLAEPAAPEAPAYPSGRSLLTGFLVGALLVVGWSVYRQADRHSAAEQRVIDQCRQAVTDDLGYAAPLDDAELVQVDGSRWVSGTVEGDTWRCRLVAGQVVSLTPP